MKRVITVVLLIVIAVSLTACSTRPEGTEMQTLVTKSGMVKAVYDYDAQTITVGGDAYHYEYSGGDCTITYPNGAAYWESATSYGAVSGWDGDYDTELYIDGSVLANI